MKKTLAGIFIALLFGCGPAEQSGSTQSSQLQLNRVSVQWDEYGIPHIEANNLQALYYGMGRAQAYNHGKLMLKNYAKGNGMLARFEGEKGLNNDLLLNRIGLLLSSTNSKAQEDPEVYAALEQFVKGVNDELAHHKEALGEYAAMLPITVDHVLNVTKFGLFVTFSMGRELSDKWPKPQNFANTDISSDYNSGDHRIGSNAYAFSGKRTESGHALLLMNPHMLWHGEFKWYEKNLYLGDLKASGVGIVGMPGILIGFNQNGGWTHTVNGADIADRFELVVKDGGYYVDGERSEFTTSKFNIAIKQADGSVVEKEYIRKTSIFGDIIAEADGKALALKIAGLKTNGMFSQYNAMLKAKNLSEFKAAIKREKAPFLNVIYADQLGNIFYSSNGFYPKRKPQVDYKKAAGVFDASTSEWLWQGYHSFADYPKVENPAIGWIQNSNDSPWTTTWPQSIKSSEYPAYIAWPEKMSHRNQNALTMAMSEDKISFDKLEAMQQSTRIVAADFILDDLIALLNTSQNEQLIAAAKVLANWDRFSHAESQGAALFIDWLNGVGLHNVYKNKWDINQPFTTPNGLADPDNAIKQMHKTIAKFNNLGYALDIPFGEIYITSFDGKTYPASGYGGHFGPFRVGWYTSQDNGQQQQVGGNSYVGAVEFGDTVKARGLLSYPNATFNKDTIKISQPKLFSERKWRDIYLKKPDQSRVTREKFYSVSL